MRTHLKLISISLFTIMLTCSALYASSNKGRFDADRKAIFGEPFSHLKEQLERAFPRDPLISQWIQEITAKYPSVLYMIVTNSDNQLVDSYFDNSLKNQRDKITDEFLKVDKLLEIQEEIKMKKLGELQMMISRDKIVIEMDTYHFETGFGPVK